MAVVNPFLLPFVEAIAFFRRKINLLTAHWDQIWEYQNTHAFTVAGVLREDLLNDFRAEIDKGNSEGTGYAAFRERFDEIVEQYGWKHNGGPGWRSRVIYHTNMQTAYQAGRYKQQKQFTARRPYLQYRHSKFVAEPRLQHVQWDGLVLRHDDPWWQYFYPPNGWGCKCKVHALSQRDLERMGKTGPDTAPEIVWIDREVGKRGPNPRIVPTPEGIDPGWAYNVGESSPGQVAA